MLEYGDGEIHDNFFKKKFKGISKEEFETFISCNLEVQILQQIGLWSLIEQKPLTTKFYSSGIH